MVVIPQLPLERTVVSHLVLLGGGLHTERARVTQLASQRLERSMKSSLDGVLGLSNDRSDLGEAEAAVKPKRDHGAIARFEHEKRSTDTNQVEVVQRLQPGVGRLQVVGVTPICRTLTAPVADRQVGCHSNQPGLLIGSGRQTAAMFPDPEEGVMGDFGRDVPIEDDEIRAAHDRSIGCAVQAVKPILRIHARQSYRHVRRNNAAAG